MKTWLKQQQPTTWIQKPETDPRQPCLVYYSTSMHTARTERDIRHAEINQFETRHTQNKANKPLNANYYLKNVVLKFQYICIYIFYSFALLSSSLAKPENEFPPVWLRSSNQTKPQQSRVIKSGSIH